MPRSNSGWLRFEKEIPELGSSPSQADVMSYIYWFSVGLDVLPQYNLAQSCILNISNLYIRAKDI